MGKRLEDSVTKVTLKDRLRYWFDNLMSRGPTALIALLALLSLVIIVVVSLVVQAAQIAPEDETGSRLGFVQVVWMGLMRRALCLPLQLKLRPVRGRLPIPAR